MAFDLDRYLDRLGLTERPTGADGLARLQEAQMRAIPFEAVDPFLGVLPDLSDDGLWTKLITDRRGGYCFELNTLFGLALDALDYRPQMLMCRVRQGADRGGARTHLAFAVETDGVRWLCDTGFGGPGARRPLHLDSRDPQTIGQDVFRLRNDVATGELVVDKHQGDGWFPLYGTDFSPVQFADIEAANFLCTHWNRTPFQTFLMAAILTDTGRASLFNLAFKQVTDGQEETRMLGDAQELGTVLAGVFGLNLDDATIRAAFDKAANAPLSR